MIEGVQVRVVATDPQGIVQYEQVFAPNENIQPFDFRNAARQNALRIGSLFPECKVDIREEPLSPDVCRTCGSFMVHSRLKGYQCQFCLR